uniref:Serine/threonine protein phosphatase n=1 Tax=Dictyoglomus thermophilum TaxID=14 RepID=A0A7C3MJ97_DICTH
MRILAISDLHLDYIRLRNGLNLQEEREILRKIRDYLLTDNPNILIIGGDISSKIWEVELFFEEFSYTNINIVFVPGNHDVWKEGKITSTDKYYYILPNICEDFGIHFLPRNPFITGKWAFLGTLGWYDYTLGNSDYPKEDYDKGVFRGLKWRETFWKLINFTNINGNCLSNIEICKLFIEELEKDFYKVENFNKIVITHMLPFKELVMIKNFFSAYLGSEKLGEVILKNKADFVICGHEHNPQSLTIYNIKIEKPTFGYLDSLRNLKDRLDKAKKLIEI